MTFTPTYVGNERDRLLERPLPHNAEAERAILGAITLDNSLIIQAAELLHPDELYVRAHHFVFRAMLSLHARGSEINPILLGEELRREGVLEQVGGVAFISELTYGLPHFTNVAAYAKVVKGKALLRQLVKVANRVSSEALEEEDDADVIVDRAEQMIFELRAGRRGKGEGALSYAEVWERFVKRQQEMASGRYAPIPFFDLPRLNGMAGGGMYEQQLITVAALTSRGKSSFAKQVVDYNAAQGVGAIYFSREMSDIAILGRSLAALTAEDGELAVPANQIRRAYSLDEHRKGRVLRAGAVAARWPVWVETRTANVGEIYTIVRHWLARTYPEWLRRNYPDNWEAMRARFLIVVDYAQLLFGSKPRYNTKAEEYAEIWRSLKNMAQDFEGRVLALAQFNNTAYNGTRPRLSQIEGSGEAMKATNMGIVIWSEEEKIAEAQKAKATRYPVKFYIEKQTEGPTGYVEAEYDTQTLEFYPPSIVDSGDFNNK